ncbi:hypothetical protein SAMN05444158_1285 [Bradyrhizobium canariense]|uniref:Uncharacterized protein n=1 Tax=Bradyrhizobium canariense TaxID=255045 RepID=A0A1H1Q661_9BRAD|nr:hypothetical protein SAMN05444158_1285 [Bradyrhizobium canariense]
MSECNYWPASPAWPDRFVVERDDGLWSIGWTDDAGGPFETHFRSAPSADDLSRSSVTGCWPPAKAHKGSRFETDDRGRPQGPSRPSGTVREPNQGCGTPCGNIKAAAHEVPQEQATASVDLQIAARRRIGGAVFPRH